MDWILTKYFDPKPKKPYAIYRDHGTHRELIGNLYLKDILAIHGKKVTAICDIRYEVTVRA